MKRHENIKVFQGILSTQTTTLIHKIKNDLLHNDPNTQILEIDYYHQDERYLDSIEQLKIHLDTFLDPTKSCAVFLLNMQLFSNLDDFIAYANKKENIQFYVFTSLQLFKDPSCKTIYPTSFESYCISRNINHPYQKDLDAYLHEGGLLEVTPSLQTRLSFFLKSTLRINIIQYYHLTHQDQLDELIHQLVLNIGCLTNASKLSKQLSNLYPQVNHVTIQKYLTHLLDAFVFVQVKRFDIHQQKPLKTLDKYYLIDPSLMFVVLDRQEIDLGPLYENVVAIELLRRGYEIYVGKLYEKEIDFVAIKQSEKLYIQVSDNISDPTTLQRELAPLQSIKDAYPKLLLANTHHEAYDIQGIHIIDISTWLINK